MGLCKRQKIDNDIVPEEVAELLTPQHTLLIIKNIKEKRENPVKETDDEAFISENADILPPEVARELSRKRRREVCKKIRTRRQKKEAAGTRTNSAHTSAKDDEAFIKENLHLVPRGIAELLDSNQRRKLVSVVLEIKKLLEEEEKNPSSKAEDCLSDKVNTVTDAKEINQD